MMSTGPLKKLKVVEFCGLGPVTFAGMMLSDLGADVVRVIRPGHIEQESGATLRGRRNLTADLRNEDDARRVRQLIAQADVLIEGFRPGVMEKLGFGPKEMHAQNTRLVYGRMTGWGQSGPLKHKAGHDINYISIAGVLGSIGTDRPEVPLNLIGDYGAGALYLVVGVLAALVNIQNGGTGQTIDSAICDGSVSMMSLIYGLLHNERWNDTRATNKLDGAYPRYRAYECKDGLHISVGALEEKFFSELRAKLHAEGFDVSVLDSDHDWAAANAALEALFLKKTRDEWAELFAATDACVTPVNSILESLQDPHLLERATFISLQGETQPAPAPRFSKTPGAARASNAVDFNDILEIWRTS